jgi:hypothetical protein
MARCAARAPEHRAERFPLLEFSVLTGARVYTRAHVHCVLAGVCTHSQALFLPPSFPPYPPFTSLHKLREREIVQAAVEAAVSDPFDVSVAQVMAAMCVLCQCSPVLVCESAAPRWESTARG